ncbi:MAG: toast rack family protein [Gemmatimonadales bacterium]
MSGRALLLVTVAALGCNHSPRVNPAWRTVTAAQGLRGEHEATVNVQYGAGRFHLTPGTGDELYRMQLRYDENSFTPVREYDPATQTLHLGVKGRSGGIRVRSRHGDAPPSMDLALTPSIPLTLILEMGAVEADVDLGGLALHRATFRTGASSSHLRFARPNTAECEELTIEAGAAELHAEQLANSNCARVNFNGGVGEVTLDYSGTWRRSMTADVNVGVGSLKLKLPRSVGVSVHLNRFLASFDAAGFEKRGDTYVTSNFESAKNRLEMNVNASIGGVDVEWVNP